MADLDHYKKVFAQERNRLIGDYCHFLRFKSISTDPEYKAQVLECCAWVAERLKKMGLTVTVLETPHYPVILAEKRAEAKAPTVLFYGHYDVQPVDPIQEWHSDPFEPRIEGDQVFARGAQDNKGQCFAMMEAVGAYLASPGEKQCHVKVVIEGEEECGSLGFGHLLKEKKGDFSADYLVVNDVTIPAHGEPAVSLGARGMVAMEVCCKGVDTDLHSGAHGGMALNPIRALIDVLSLLHNGQGKIQIPHFYDDVLELTPEQKSLLDHPFDAAGYKKEFGIRAFSGEEGYSLWEANWVRPSLEINGIWGGYTGEGFKTVIPKEARAKISCRLVSSQDPTKVEKQIVTFIKDNVAKGMEISVKNRGGGHPVMTSPKSKIAQIAQKAYADVFGKPCRFVMMGGSIPVIADLVKVAGCETVFTGTGLMSDNIHAPNEHYGLDRLEQCFLTITQILERVHADGRD